MVTTHSVPNKLAQEQSPYLRQHALNPVDWYPWGAEAFAKANVEQKPLLVSIGYSACHWCHVMARESFEDAEIAGLMNQYFVCIKVDREERPDLDKVYQEACHLLTRQGGWPLTIFATPEGWPFYAGTYFPPQNRWGQPGFKELVIRLGQAYQEEPASLVQLAQELVGAVQANVQISRGDYVGDLASDLLLAVSTARENLYRYFDPLNGGFGEAPKFPAVPQLELLWTARDERYQKAVRFTLGKMVAGGIYDQLGGGFHRYSVDRSWRIPHFEKMLYDNALLADLLVRVNQHSAAPELREAAQGTLDYVLKELTSPRGEFFASQDADVDGIEGTYYLWTEEEIQECLSPDEATTVIKYFSVTKEGNFADGKSVLIRAVQGAIPSHLHLVLEKLLKFRERRTPPHRDEKVIIGWNGLMVTALVHGYQALKEIAYLQVAEKNVRTLLKQLRGDRGEGPLFNDDYAFYIAGLLDLYAATGTEYYLAQAVELQGEQLDRYYDQSSGGFFLNAADPTLFVRPKDGTDNAIPSGEMIGVLNLIRLCQLKPELAQEYRPRIEKTLRLYLSAATRNPWSYATYLRVAEFYLSSGK